MKIDFLDFIFSACVSLRKLRKLRLHQLHENRGKRIFEMRPQIHILLVSPFGTAKSSVTKNLSAMPTLVKEILAIDDFTKASVEGSINKNGEYVPSIFLEVGGKLLIIDEWNNVDPFGQTSLLSAMENNKFGRSLGFKLNKPVRKKKKHAWVYAKDNILLGESYFSCIAYAMEYPSGDQKSKALISRFSPVFIEPNQKIMEAITSGNFNIDAKDFSGIVEEVDIPYEVCDEIHNKFWEYINKNKLIPVDSNDMGFLSRCYSEIIRYGIYTYMKDKDNTSKNIIIKDSSCFISNFKYIITIMNMFINRTTKGKINLYDKFLRIKKEEIIEMTISEIAEIMGVSRPTIYAWNEKLIGKYPYLRKVEKEINLEEV